MRHTALLVLLSFSFHYKNVRLIILASSYCLVCWQSLYIMYIMVRDPSAKPIRNTTKAHPRVSVAMCISHLIDVASVVNNKDNNYPFHHICTLCKSPKCVLRLLVYNPRDHPSLCEDDFVPPSIKQQYPTTNKMRCWW